VPDVKRFSLVRPTPNTAFHIDFDWWSQNERNWRVHLVEYLTPEHRAALNEAGAEELFDIIDAQTAEVRQVDALQHLLISHYAGRESFLNETSSLVETVFRLFLSNGNTPLSAQEIADKLHRPSETILRVLASGRVYRGLRPYSGGA
jgi:hypothetical protein